MWVTTGRNECVDTDWLLKTRDIRSCWGFLNCMRVLLLAILFVVDVAIVVVVVGLLWNKLVATELMNAWQNSQNGWMEWINCFYANYFSFLLCFWTFFLFFIRKLKQKIWEKKSFPIISNNSNYCVVCVLLLCWLCGEGGVGGRITCIIELLRGKTDSDKKRK